jgi:uncharacterized protein YkwD
MSPEAFAGRADAQEALDPGALDHPLLSAAIFHETNLRRTQTGRPRLVHDPRLDRAAGLQADIMAERNVLTHANPDPPGLRTPSDRVRAAGLVPGFVAENVATHFGIPYRSGSPIYRVDRDGRRGFSATPGGPPIPPHTYLTFARSLLDQWMASPDHRQNILSKSAEWMGSACAPRDDPTGMVTYFCAQVFTSKS